MARLPFFIFLMLVAVPALAAALWYEGGTLQKATVAEWQMGNAADQLATAGDFIAALNGISDLGAVKNPEILEGIKKQAQELVGCVNQTVKQADMQANQPVAQIVVNCALVKRK